ncbi:MAG: hypothetical protein K6A62_01870 [Bacteroidales bacterium]|nr:hypothetical protein [Bacteroidales bacterium]
MRTIIEYANKRISLCVDCSFRQRCSWFGSVANNVELSVLTPEQLAEMTYEERAIHDHDCAGSPQCEEQAALDSVLSYVECLVDQAEIPVLSGDLINLLTRMSRLERRLKQIPAECSIVFDSSTRAIIERCLAAIDYFFLQSGIDIVPLLYTIHSNYHREKILHQYYLRGVVGVMIMNAKKPTLNRIVSFNGSLLALAFPLTSSSSSDEESTDETPAPKATREVSSWVNDFTDLIVSSQTFDFLEAVIAYMGYSPFTYMNFVPMELRHFSIEKGTTSNELYVYEDMPKVFEEIDAAIKERKDNDFALKLYLSGIISPFSQLASGLFGPTTKQDVRATQAFIGISTPFRLYTLDEFKERWDKAVKEIKTIKKESDETFYSDVANLMVEKYDDMQVTEHGPNVYCIEALSDLLFSIQDFESCIEAALILNNIGHDYLYYEDYAKVQLGGNVSEHSVSKYLGLTPAAIQSLSKDLNHNIIFAVKEGETLDDFCLRVANSQNHTGNEDRAGIAPLPATLEKARGYLDVAREAGYLAQNYAWAKRDGTSNNYAVLFAKVIQNQYPDITYEMLGNLFGISHLGSYLSRAKGQENVKRLILCLFSDKGMPATLD